MSGGNIKVVVRCRPLNSRELGRGAKELIRMEDNQTILDPPDNTGPSSSKATEKKTMTFSFDKSYWSAGARDKPDYASQQTLYDDLGVELLDHSFEGFNTCIFAYGQTGSGKSYSMMGYGADKGIIPLTTSELFRRVEERSDRDAKLSYTVEVSYIEIYNEKVRDLLNPKNKGNLRVREHPSLGPYVEDLSRLVVENYGQMMTLMDEGNKARTVASTNMNETSSRSHAVFTVILTQKRHDAETNMTGEKVSKISLVDLAGSERQASTGATGTRLKEGANINKSLTTLGKVIAALAQASETVKGKKKKDDFVPYRDSVLTWLLKESLGGNSKTAMIAAISPADYEETLSTLRYADAAKRIKTHAVVNEDPNAKLIRELKEELDMLRSRVAAGSNSDEAAYDPTLPLERQMVTYQTKDGEIRKVSKLELQDQLQASEKLMEGLNLTWEEKMAKTQAIHVEREKALEELGIMVDKHLVGVHAPQKHPSLVNLNEDPLMSECLVYQLKPGTTIAGGIEDTAAHIKLSGTNILPEHCTFSNDDGVVTVEAMPDARTFVNGKRVPPKSPIKLLNGYRVILGDFHVFRFNDPASVRAHREKLRGSTSIGDLNGYTSIDGSPGLRADSPMRGDEMMDWSAARREVADIEKLGDQDLDKLFDDIIKVRTQRKRPESRHDLAADLEGRFMSTSQTEESLENPWAAAQGTTMTSTSLGTPAALDGDKDIDVAEEPSETGTEPRSPAYRQKKSDATLQQQHLTKQLQQLAKELKRTKSEAAAARALDNTPVESAGWTTKELSLVKWSIDRWKKLQSYKMAETMLLRAADLKEANVIATELSKNVSYNFLLISGSGEESSSSLEASSGLADFEAVSSAGQTTAGASLVVKVIDISAHAVYVWEMSRFDHQLAKMRHARALQLKPGHSEHFRLDGTFAEHPAPQYTYIGSSKIPLKLLSTQTSSAITLPILCRYTMEAIGSCRVALQCSRSPMSGSTTPDSTWPLLQDLVPGEKMTFTLILDTVKGLSSGDFHVVHAQIRLSSLVGTGISSDDVYTSQPVDLEKTSIAHLSLRRYVSVIVTQETIDHLSKAFATLEFFAKVRPEYLSRLERFDRNRDSASMPVSPAAPGLERRPSMRRCDTDFIAPEHHDILASVYLKELTAEGDYAPAEVVDDVFHLHQGVQRQLHIRLSHTSGQAISWNRLEHVSTSNVRVETKGQVASVGESSVPIQMLGTDVTHETDGTSSLSAYGIWDSSAHHCSHLDRRTNNVSQLMVKLTFLVDFDGLDEPAVFQLDLPIRILGRDSRRSSLLSFFSSEKVYSSFTRVFGLDLVPPMARSADDLWKLDTSGKSIPGEEILGDRWRCRGLSLLEDFDRLKRSQRGLCDVQVTKVVLDLAGDIQPTSRPEAEQRDLLARYFDLWSDEVRRNPKLELLEQREKDSPRLEMGIPDLRPKLSPRVSPVIVVNTVIKQGILHLLRSPSANIWEKVHVVLRRPYLFIHPSPSEREDQVVNLSKASVTSSPDVEALLGRRYAFTIFTPTNSYIMQAGSKKQEEDWISVIAVSEG